MLCDSKFERLAIIANMTYNSLILRLDGDLATNKCLLMFCRINHILLVDVKLMRAVVHVDL